MSMEAYRCLLAPQGFEPRFICLIAGRLGLHAGEIAHFWIAWVNRNQRTFPITQYDLC